VSPLRSGDCAATPVPSDALRSDLRQETVTYGVDHTGRATFVSAGWHALTGQSCEKSLEFGWVEALHPEDRTVARDTVVEAIERQCAFSLRYRLLSRTGRYIWVATGALPSFGPPGRTFLDFLGSLTPIADAEMAGLKAFGSLGSLVCPPTRPEKLPSSGLELAADHLIMAHTLVAQSEADRVGSALETALLELGRELARRADGPWDLSTFQ